jgi:hypothetical protein
VSIAVTSHRERRTSANALFAAAQAPLQDLFRTLEITFKSAALDDFLQPRLKSVQSKAR